LQETSEEIQMRRISRQDITVPNILTLLRILMALCAALLFILGDGFASIAASMLLIASALDFFDGWYARRFRQTTSLGAHLDPFADKVMTAVIFVTLSYRFWWSWFTLFVAVILFREIIITVYRMMIHSKSGTLVPASILGKVKTVVQCIVGDILIFYIYIYPGRMPGHRWLIFIAMMITMAITVDSGLRYILPSCADGKKRSVIERLMQWIFGIGAREA
jgi:CDP-diacylglycerol--glycerol-3-phosphate 3-phosphatidyltransferase